MLTKLHPSKKFGAGYEINGIKFCLTNHALERALERNVDIEKRILSLKGLKVSQYRDEGVICKYDKWQKTITIVTLLSRRMVEINRKNKDEYRKTKI